MWPSSSNSYKIRANFYLGKGPTPQFPSVAGGRCLCAGKLCYEEGQSSCTNYHARILCDDDNCSSGLGCGNRFIQTSLFDVVTSALGWAAVTLSPLPKDSFVLEYVGELIYEDTKERRPQDYMFELTTPTVRNQKVYIDARVCGNESRFVNHSCSPNCAWFEFQSRDGPRIGIYSLRRIRRGEEITVSYRRSKLWFDCRCNALNCQSKSH